MMDNKAIAKQFDLLAKIMELYDENPFKIRSYATAYNTLRKIEEPLGQMSIESLSEIKGVGKAIAEKIQAITITGSMPALERYLASTPPGIVEMLTIKGLGPKKVKVIWQTLGIETVGDLQLACEENRLIKVKGFGAKLQGDILNQIEFYLSNQGLYKYASVIDSALEVVKLIQTAFPDHQTALTGDIRRQMPIVDSIEILSDVPLDRLRSMEFWEADDHVLKYEGITMRLYHADPESFGSQLFTTTGPDVFVSSTSIPHTTSEEAVFEALGLPYILPALRDIPDVANRFEANEISNQVIQLEDIKGIIHSHSTYTDGVHTLADLARYVRDQGFEYLVISDHSQTASYAGGLKANDILRQHQEIEQLNVDLAPFKIFRSIESDILSDGSLDYPVAMLNTFDLVISSIHSNLKMDEPTATQRLLNAIRSPYTTILGHPTGRLLLARQGYPIDHKAIIDACADHQVVIELNANPLRLDMDWTWIDYARTKKVKIAINPDAHSKQAIHLIKYGVLAAQKGGLQKDECINTLSLSQFEAWLQQIQLSKGVIG